MVCSKIPTQVNREFLPRIREFLSKNREFQVTGKKGEDDVARKSHDKAKSLDGPAEDGAAAPDPELGGVDRYFFLASPYG
jgi:hypothetical protein